MTTMETALGWGIIIAGLYMLTAYTNVTASMANGVRSATVSVRGVTSRQRLLDAGGLLGGIMVGPKVIAWVMAALGGALGAVSLSSLGFTDKQVFIAGMVTIAVFVLLSRRG